MTPPSATPRPEDPDAPAVAAARAGDVRATERLLADHYERLYTLCRRLCHDMEQAQDATQNTLIAIVRGLPKFDGRSTFATWSYRIATNCALDELRRAARHHARTLDLTARAVEADVLELPERPTTGGGLPLDPGEAVVTAELRARLGRALDELDPRFRVPLVLYEVAGHDYDEIAGILELAPGTVRSRIHRARRHLASLLADSDLDPRSGSGNQDAPGDVRTDGP